MDQIFPSSSSLHPDACKLSVKSALLSSILAALGDGKSEHIGKGSPTATKSVLAEYSSRLTDVCDAISQLAQLSDDLEVLTRSKETELSAHIHDWAGTELMRRGEATLATRCFHRAAAYEPFPDRFSLYFHLCEAYYAQGRFKSAVRYGAQAAAYSEVGTHRSGEEASVNVTTLCSLMAKCEERLRRFDKAKAWLKRALIAMHPPQQLGKPTRKDEGRLRRGSPTHYQELLSAEKCIVPKGERGLRMARSGSLGDLQRDPPHHVRFDLQPTQKKAHMNFPASARSPRPSIDTQSTDCPPLYECRKKLSNGSAAHVQITEGPNRVWILSVGTGEGMKVYETITLDHPWRGNSMETIARHVEIRPDGGLTLGQEEEKQEVVELGTEVRFFQGERFRVTFLTNESLHHIEIKAQSAAATLSRIVLNDIHLTTAPALAAYSHQVLSPQMYISCNQIHISPQRPKSQLTAFRRSDTMPVLFESSPGKSLQHLLYTGKVVIEPNLPAFVAVFKSDIAWTLNVRTKMKTEELAILQTEVKDICGDLSDSEAAKVLADRLVFEKDGLKIKAKKENVGIALRISEPQSGTKVYTRDYKGLREKRPSTSFPQEQARVVQ